MADYNNDKALFDEIAEVIESNGSIDRDTRDRFLLAGLRAVYNAQISYKEQIDKRLVKIEKYIPFLDAAKWVTVILGGSVVALIWALITGRATIIFVP